MLILVRPHVSLLDGPAVAAWLPRIGLVQAVFAVDPDYARHPVWSRLLKAYGWLTGGHTMLPLDATRPFAMRELLRILDQGRDVVIFPQGTGIGDSARPDAGGCGWLLEKTSRRVMEITLSHEARWPGIQRYDFLAICKK
ncbi:1-acyl-sn-glycerol-3-phosphate acyltransferase [Acidithiobacillus ferrivorans]|nr:1-acyl-sn-glycerol-3-phosphate acyltransferase [Acidithiobacillus ferrivorans]